MKSLRLFAFLLQNSRGTVILMTLSGVLTGLLSAGILALVSHAVSKGHQITTMLVVGFIVVAAAKILANATTQLLLVRFSQTTILELSLSLCAKILNAPLRMIERRGTGSVLAILTDDVTSVTWGVQCLPQLAMNGAVVIGCSVYLAWLSWRMFLGTVIVTLFGVGVYKLLYTKAFKHIHAARDSRTVLFDHFRSLTTGMKELMMHGGRREAFLRDAVRPAANDYRDHNMAATTHYAIAESWVQTLYHGLIALVLFTFPLFTRTNPEVMTGYVFSLLYMMTPLWTIIGALPAVARGQVALAKIEDLGLSLDAASTAAIPASTGAQADGAATSVALASCSEIAPIIEMTQIGFTYEAPTPAANGTSNVDGGVGAGGDGKFSLGPIDFRLAPGELVFVVGGNGSGKSTFVKILTGLYAPHEGQLQVGNTLVNDALREWYRDHFSVVFADCFVFNKLLGLTGPDLDATALQYLQLLQIDHKVSLRNGPTGREFSTVDLSTGQRKRLALVTAYLEDRPYYVFDEWAADQDPEYKRIFYSKLLPDLRNRGKAVVVITHDDRYFHMGDRVIKLEDGKIVSSAV